MPPPKNAINETLFTEPRAKGMLTGMCVKGNAAKRECVTRNTAQKEIVERVYEMGIAPYPAPLPWLPPKPVFLNPVAVFGSRGKGKPFTASLASIASEKGKPLKGYLMQGLTAKGETEKQLRSARGKV